MAKISKFKEEDKEKERVDITTDYFDPEEHPLTYFATMKCDSPELDSIGENKREKSLPKKKITLEEVVE
jgi:hypothetical protein